MVSLSFSDFPLILLARSFTKLEPDKEISFEKLLKMEESS
jgi:hypothetical protein